MNCIRKRNFRSACAVSTLFLIISGAASRAQNPIKDDASCSRFVQQFYDWYLERGSPWYDVVKLKPQVLSVELRELLRKEDVSQTACQCIDHLDSDPFLNSQDPDRRYVVRDATVTNGKCKATVKGTGQDGAEVRPELVRTGASWVFINFHYSFYAEDKKTKLYPDWDLVSMLKR